jgi:hypothetical protein
VRRAPSNRRLAAPLLRPASALEAGDLPGHAGAQRVGGNVRVSQFTWDPDQPQQTVGGLTQYPCAAHTDPCPAGGGFIGDYFGLAISARNLYTFAVSTHYPSRTVRADDGGPVYYQDQALGIVPRTTFGSGY